MVLILFAFLAGIVTILSPCILPLLPIILTGSINEGKKRPLGIIAGFAGSFAFFTLTISYLARLTGLTTESLRIVAAFIIILFGLSMAVPFFQEKMELFLSSISKIGNKKNQNRTGFTGGFLIGISLGIVWTPCVGPIMAGVITLAISETVSLMAVFITLAYTVGTSLPMLGIILLERRLIDRLSWFKKNSGKIQRGFAVLMIFFGVGLFFNVDRMFQIWVLDTIPGYGESITAIEENEAVLDSLKKLDM